MSIQTEALRKCAVCNDTGSKSKRFDGDLDCAACDATDKRLALRKHLAQFTGYPENDAVAWATYLFAQHHVEAERVLRDGIAPSIDVVPRQMVREAIADLFMRMNKSYAAEPTRRITFMDLDAIYMHVKRMGIGGCLDNAEEIIAGMKANSPVVAPTAVVAVPKQPEPEMREFLRDALASGLSGVYYCDRVWSAWGVGTMTQDAFTEASEIDDIVDNLCDIAIATLGPFAVSQPAAAPSGDVERDAIDRLRKAHSEYMVRSHVPAVAQELSVAKLALYAAITATKE